MDELKDRLRVLEGQRDEERQALGLALLKLNSGVEAKDEVAAARNSLAENAPPRRL